MRQYTLRNIGQNLRFTDLALLPLTRILHRRRLKFPEGVFQTTAGGFVYMLYHIEHGGHFLPAVL